MNGLEISNTKDTTIKLILETSEFHKTEIVKNKNHAPKSTKLQ